MHTTSQVGLRRLQLLSLLILDLKRRCCMWELDRVLIIIFNRVCAIIDHLTSYFHGHRDSNCTFRSTIHTDIIIYMYESYLGYKGCDYSYIIYVIGAARHNNIINNII